MDPERSRMYVGSSDGRFLALRPDGRRVYSVNAEGPIAAGIAIDGAQNKLYFATTQGRVGALRAIDGESVWNTELGAAIRRAPLVHDGTVFVVTERDQVVALTQDSGDPLWTFERARPSGFTIAGSAGLTLHNGLIYTAFSDGSVVALEPERGEARWVAETAVDVPRRRGGQPRILDVDTTPIVMGSTIVVGSFAAGLYGFESTTGTQVWRMPELTGAVGIASTPNRLVVASADSGIVCLDAETRAPLWTREVERGAPSEPVIVGGLTFIGESGGALLALDVFRGDEMGRIESRHGFTARVAAVGGKGLVVSNGGTLYAFEF